MNNKLSKHNNFVILLAAIVLISLGLGIIMKDIYGVNSWQLNIFMILVLSCTLIRIVDIVISLIRKVRNKLKKF